MALKIYQSVLCFDLNLHWYNKLCLVQWFVLKMVWSAIFENHLKDSVYDRSFFICSIKSNQCTDKYSKKVFSIAIFLSRVLMYQKHQISLPVGYKTTRPKTGDWEQLWRQFRTPSLAKNRFLRRFLIFS